MNTLLMALAGLFGAAGVALMAAGSHSGSGLATLAGQMLLFHAPAVLAITVALGAGRLHPAIGRWAAAILALGAAVFAADLTVRTYGWERLFPLAAPIGGTMLILGWVVLAVAALLPVRRSR